VVGTLIYLLSAIARPDETILWLYAATYAIEGFALWALWLAARQEPDLTPRLTVGASGEAHEPNTETDFDGPSGDVQGSDV
jgi:hypothetical protein